MTTKELFEVLKKEECPHFSLMELKMHLYRYEEFSDFWNKCGRGDFMIHIASILDIDFCTISNARGRIANIVRHLIKNYKSLLAVDTAMSLTTNNVIDERKIQEISDDALYVCSYGQLNGFIPAYNYASMAAFYSLVGTCNVIKCVAFASYYSENGMCISDSYSRIQMLASGICKDVITDSVSKYF